MNPAPLHGDELPALLTQVPGPRSQALAARLAAVESRNITHVSARWPIFWRDARGSAVRDVDGNTFVDMTAGFGVAHAGHAHPEVAAAIARQAATLAHALGDVHPPEIKVALLERLAALAPGDLAVSILGSAGAEAVEAALKTALLHTGRAGVIAFRGGYHGLTYGALSVCGRDQFRAPFAAQLPTNVSFAEYPDARTQKDSKDTIAELRGIIAAAEHSTAPIGALIVEPLQGRGGLVVPPADFLPQLRALCDGVRTLLIVDEIYTGFGRTGRWFAVEHAGVVPDLLVVGKALTGSIALSAVIGTAPIMNAWPVSDGEAMHTSTFLGNPVACAAALAQISAIEKENLLERAATIGARIADRAEAWRRRSPLVSHVAGAGILQGIRLSQPVAAHLAEKALARGVIVLPEGPGNDVLALTPPAVITDAQLDAALGIIELIVAG